MKILVTGSTTGIGFLTARKLIENGNDVYLHARNKEKAIYLKNKLPQAKNVLIGDLGKRSEVIRLSKEINKLGQLNTIIHNAGVYSSNNELIFKVNVLAPYIMSSLIRIPKKIIFTSSNMHLGASLVIDQIEKDTDYSSSKLQVLLLAKSIARLHKNTIVTTVDPGWVPTRMGGSQATDSLIQGYPTQVYLATLDNNAVSGKYFYHLKETNYDVRVDNIDLQNKFLEKMYKITKLKI